MYMPVELTAAGSANQPRRIAWNSRETVGTLAPLYLWSALCSAVGIICFHVYDPQDLTVEALNWWQPGELNCAAQLHLIDS